MLDVDRERAVHDSSYVEEAQAALVQLVAWGFLDDHRVDEGDPLRGCELVLLIPELEQSDEEPDRRHPGHRNGNPRADPLL